MIYPLHSDDLAADYLLSLRDYELEVSGGGAEGVTSVALQVLQPTDTFRCEHYSCTLQAQACVLRQQVTVNSMYGNPLVDQKQASYCRTGECTQGKGVAAALGGKRIAEARRPKWQAQLAAKRRAARLASPAALITAKIDSGEFRPWEPLPPAVREEIGEDLEEAVAPPAGKSEDEIAEVAAAVEQRRSWAEFRAQRDAERAETEDESPAPPPPICKVDGCRTALRVNNLTGLCRLHRNKVTSRKREGLVPAVARAAGTTRNALEADVEEEPVENRKCKFEGCGYPLRSDNTSGLCGWHCNGRSTPRPNGWKAPGKNGQPAPKKPARRKRAAAPPATSVQVLPGLLQAAGDVEQLLEQRRQHHLAEADRCERALKALKVG